MTGSLVGASLSPFSGPSEPPSAPPGSGAPFRARPRRRRRCADLSVCWDWLSGSPPAGTYIEHNLQHPGQGPPGGQLSEHQPGYPPHGAQRPNGYGKGLQPPAPNHGLRGGRSGPPAEGRTYACTVCSSLELGWDPRLGAWMCSACGSSEVHDINIPTTQSLDRDGLHGHDPGSWPGRGHRPRSSPASHHPHADREAYWAPRKHRCELHDEARAATAGSIGVAQQVRWESILDREHRHCQGPVLAEEPQPLHVGICEERPADRAPLPTLKRRRERLFSIQCGVSPRAKRLFIAA